jgi:hypothetical protein
MKKKFREMHEHMQEEQVKQEAFNQQSATQKSSSTPRSADYIDFEEIK